MDKIPYRKRLLIKVTLSFLTIIVLTTGSLLGIMYYENYSLLVSNVGNKALQVAKVAADKVDVEELKKFETIDHMERTSYKDIKEKLYSIKNISGAKYLYIMRQNENGEYTYVIETIDIDKGETSEINRVEEDFFPEFEIAMNGNIYVDDKIWVDDEYGIGVTSCYPLKDKTGEVVGFVGVDYDVETEYKAFHKMKQNIIMIALGILVLISIISIALLKRTIQPIENMAKMANKIANYDLSVENIPIETKDEIGLLARSFNKMIENLRELIQHIKNTSEGLGACSQQLAASSEQSNTMADHVAETMDKLARDAIENSSSVEEATQTINTMSTNIEQISNNAQTTRSTGKSAEEAGEKGKEAVNRSIQTMAQVQKFMKEAVESTHTLGKNSKEIGNIIEIITSIADQTNLLALNAAIEAARAGDSGRGFAVVAEEVRKLAEESSNAASQITQLIDNVQRGTDSTADLIKKGSKVVEESSMAVMETSSAFDSISTSISEIICDIEEVSRTTLKMANSSNQVVHMMDTMANLTYEGTTATQQVSATTQEQMASIEEITSNAENLAHMSDDLQKQVYKFKL
ncbi:MAG: methyl-accepting chemotaxis protein [Anaeromicrobium sp.]|uniref:methyl-accepting chemotaxis protein n=1 Tax=Anaeromicrobium sp. TaxID=1929132 RepID=UPI0025E16B0F|nr:methyl-accepting chemotaxis protein [Anaeromicrobium sp.]MCT4593777.1 methyl-accepting chemotaxis protein [Anaeromicrobium sp.]